PSQIEAELGDRALSQAATAYWGVDDGPNFEGHSILWVPRPPADAAARSGVSESELLDRVAQARRVLHAARERRVHPGLDDKVLASWNGLALAAFAEAGRALGRADYVAAAVKNARFLTTEMVDPEGRLLRSWKDGRAKIRG